MQVKLPKDEKIKILNGEDVYLIMQRILSRSNKIDRNKEHFWTIGLDNGNQILYIELISLGSTRMTLVEPMQVYRVAVLKGASRLILVHNHPSGNLEPGVADKDITDRLIQVGNIIQIEVIDHLIITEEAYYSFAATRLLDKLKKSRRYLADYELKALLKKELEGEILKKGKQEIARQMKAKGYTTKQIAELTGLSLQSIRNLKSSAE